MVRSILILFLLLSSQLASAFSYTLEIAEGELQEKVSKMMPLKLKKYFITIILTEPKINLLKDNNKIGIFTHIEVKAPGGIKGTGKVSIVGSLSYDSKNNGFFLKNPIIEKLEINKIPDKYMPKIRSISQKGISKLLTKRPVYRLKDDNLKHKLAKSVLKSVSVNNEKLFVVLSVF